MVVGSQKASEKDSSRGDVKTLCVKMRGRKGGLSSIRHPVYGGMEKGLLSPLLQAGAPASEPVGKSPNPPSFRQSNGCL